MNRIINTMRLRARLEVALLAAGAVSVALVPAAQAERVAEREARVAAENFVRFRLAQDGAWGENATARVVAVDPLTRGGRLLGYFCPVDPVGYLVISLDRELAPIRAYSTRHDLDPDAEGGMTALLKDRLDRLYAGIERTLGHAPAAGESFAAVMPVDFRGAWDVLTEVAFDPADYAEPRRSRAIGMDYQEGEELLLTTWSQEPPYNDQCPDLGCDWSAYGDRNTNAVVGCVATAGAQVMKYWNWPPYGEGSFADPYDWPRMTDMYWYDAQSDCFRNGSWEVVTEAQMAAVAELGAEIGDAVGMSYGCEGSGDYTYDMEDVYQDDFRYDLECDVQYKEDYSYAGWFTLLKNELDQNRVVQYRIPGHSIVSDGWKEENIGGQIEWIHIVYGWNGGNDGWVAPDEIPGGEPQDEYVVREIYPDVALGTTFQGTIGGPIGYTYFDRDATSLGAAIGPGVKAQVLRAGFVLEHNGPAGNIVGFFGAPSFETSVFLSGDEADLTRIRVKDGALKMYTGAQMVVH